MRDDPARILRILKRLLRNTLAHGATANEAEIAAAAARRLLDKHGLTIEQVEQLKDDPDAIHEELVGSSYRLQPPWFTGLAGCIAKGFDCEALSNLEGPMAFVGLQSDAVVAAYLFRVLSVELPKAATRSADWRRGLVARRYKVNFLLGAATRIGERLRESRRPTGKGLIVLKQSLIAQHLGDVKFRERKITIRDREGYDEGQEHADRVSIDGRKRPASSSTPLLRLEASR